VSLIYVNAIIYIFTHLYIAFYKSLAVDCAKNTTINHSY